MSRRLPTTERRDSLSFRSPDPDADTESSFGRYEGLAEINRGGMGKILAGHDVELDREVAIKVLMGGGSEREIQKFVAEARITGQLQHPNIVPVYELGTSPEGEAFFAMKKVDGESLADMLERLKSEESHSLPRLLDIFLKVCDAVAFAHARGVVHRDIKPDNVMIGRFGEVLVMDWGLALVDGRTLTDSSLGPHHDRPYQTLEGTIVGTAQFMSPEQANGQLELVGPSSDVYALGAMLYQILTLELPFPQHDIHACLDAVRDGLFERPSVRAPGRRVPHDLEQVVLKAMALRAFDRYHDVGELQEEVLAFLDGRTLQAASYTPLQRLAKWVGRHRAATAAGLLVTLTLAGALSFQRWQRRQRIGEHLGGARQAMERSDYDGALAAYTAALKIAPDNTEALTGRAAIRRLRRAQERSAMARARQKALSEELVKRMRTLLATVKRLEVGDGADPRAPDLEDLVYVGVTLRGPAAVTVLARQLDGLTRRRANHDGATPWTTGERTLAVFCCRVLARIGLPEALDPLIRWLAVVRDPQLTVEAGRALCLTRSPRAYRPLLAARGRLGLNSREWIQIRGLFNRVPEPAGAPPDPKALGERALARMDRNDYRGALADFNAAHRLSPRSPSILLNRGLCKLKLRDYTGALADYTQAIELRPRYAAAYYNRASVRRRMGDLKGALADYEQAVRNKRAEPRYWTGRGVIHQLLGSYDKAIADHTKALSLNPRLTTALINRGRARRVKGDIAGAMADYGEAIRIEPRYWGGYTYRSMARLDQGDVDGALRDINQAIKLDSEVDLSYLHRAYVWRKQKQWRRAVTDCTRALAVNPRYSLALRIRAQSRWVLGERKQALEDMNSAIKLQPGSAILRMVRGNMLHDSKRYRRALADARRALLLDNRLAGAYLLRGSCLMKLGYKKEAAADYRAYLKLTPSSPDKARLERWLRKHDPK